MRLQHTIRKILDSPLYVGVMTLLILFSVFAWDVAGGWLPVEADSIVEGILTVIFVVFILEILLMIFTTVHWWRNFTIWLFIVATAMMAFEIPWLKSALFGVSSGAGALANLRLVKVFRVLARLGRLLRIINSFVLSNLQAFVSKLVRGNSDPEDRAAGGSVKRKIVDESRKQSYDALERATTFAVVAIFSAMYVIATLFLSSIERDDSADRAFETLTANPGQHNDALPFFVATHPEVLFLSIEGEYYVDRRDVANTYRDGEVAILDNANGTIWLDVHDTVLAGARRSAVLTMVFIISISYLVIIFNWLISRFALRLSGALNTLAQALEERDAYTRMHSKNVSNYAVKVARKLNLSKQEQKVIRIAAELHDIGKIGVPQEVLGKPGKLTDEEYKIIKRHTEQGANILHHLVDFEAVILAACHHHEKYDGTGYPQGLEAKRIPKMARILAVCDVWDALTTDRPYRKAMAPATAKKHLVDGKGSEFDPDIVDAFVEAVVGH
jgi:putative nucleotidyltransferase with HDIG domain